MSEPTLAGYDRSRLIGGGDPVAITSIRDVNHEHQLAALRLGYRSVIEYAVDELLAELRDVKRRMDDLEQTIGAVRNHLSAA